MYADAEGLVVRDGGGEIGALKEELFALVDGDEKVHEVRGAVAYKGKVVGRASIISSEKEFADFERGSILITSMTRPEFLPLMKLSSAKSQST